MDNVTVVTPCRDAARQLDPYIARLTALDWPGDNLRFVMVEGDSIDHTRDLLDIWTYQDPRLTVVTCNTGKPRYGSIVNDERFQVLATVFNAGLDAVDYEWTDFVLFLPVDIRYQPDMLKRLIAHRVPLVAPFVFQNGTFYDIWAFSRYGHNLPPFHEDELERMYGTELARMDTIGGVMLQRADVLASGVRYTVEAVDRGLCWMAKMRGYQAWADPTVKVYHG